MQTCVCAAGSGRVGAWELHRTPLHATPEIRRSNAHEALCPFANPELSGACHALQVLPTGTQVEGVGGARKPAVMFPIEIQIRYGRYLPHLQYHITVPFNAVLGPMRDALAAQRPCTALKTSSPMHHRVGLQMLGPCAATPTAPAACGMHASRCGDVMSRCCVQGV